MPDYVLLDQLGFEIAISQCQWLYGSGGGDVREIQLPIWAERYARLCLFL